MADIFETPPQKKKKKKFQKMPLESVEIKDMFNVETWNVGMLKNVMINYTCI